MSLFRILSILTLLAGPSVALGGPQAYSGKIGYQSLGSRPYTQFASGFFVDEQSASTRGFHVCSGAVRMVTSNDFLKSKPLGSSVTVKLQLAYKNGETVFQDFPATIEGRDYFSQSAVLSFNDRDVQSRLSSLGSALSCVGLNNGGSSATVLGYKYNQLNLSKSSFNKSSDRGLNGGAVLDGSSYPIGVLSKDYWYKGTKDGGFQVYQFSSVKKFVARVSRGQIESSKGLITYLPNQEAFVYAGKKDSFVLTPYQGGRVEIHGSPDEVLQGSEFVNQFRQKSHNNAFSGFKATFGANNKYLLKAIDGQIVGSWSSVIGKLSSYPERSNPLVEFEVVQGGRSVMSLIAGNEYLEYLSMIRWIGFSGNALFDGRPLNSKERQVFSEMSSALNSLYQDLASYNVQEVAQQNRQKRIQLFNNMVQNIKPVMSPFFEGKSRMPRFRQKDKTLFRIQEWILSIDKWLQVERTSLTMGSAIE